MSHVGWIVADTTYSLADARAIAEREGSFDGFPPAALLALTQTREDGGLHLSPSAASGCPRQGILKKQHDYYLEPAKRWAAFVGTAVHASLADDADTHQEHFLSMPLVVVVAPDAAIGWPRQPITATIALAGTVDHYDPRTRRLTDYKTVSEFKKYDPVLRRGADREAADPGHILQLQLYRLLLEHHGHPVEEALVWYVQTYKEAKRNAFPVDLWDLEDTYELACQIAEPLARYAVTGQLPPAYTADDPNVWMCPYCPVNAICRSLP